MSCGSPPYQPISGLRQPPAPQNQLKTKTQPPLSWRRWTFVQKRRRHHEYPSITSFHYLFHTMNIRLESKLADTRFTGAVGGGPPVPGQAGALVRQRGAAVPQDPHPPRGQAERLLGASGRCARERAAPDGARVLPDEQGGDGAGV
jgi:hypothetical protein